MADDINDYGSVDFVADPFLYPGPDGIWHMFFEIYNSDRSPTGVIGHATSTTGVDWTYNQIVLELEHHISYPYVFALDNDYYMIPDQYPTTTNPRVDIFRADDFPNSWKHESTLIQPSHANDDGVVFYWEDTWWLLVGDMHSTDGLYLYHSPDLLSGEWVPHTQNPVVENRPEAVRPGGRPLVYDDHIVVFYQDCVQRYGHKLRAFEIEELTPHRYDDTELSSSPILEPTRSPIGWNSGCMHHIDPWWVEDRWLCAVDGNVAGKALFTEYQWSIGIYVAE